MKNKRILVIAEIPILPAIAGNRARIWSLMNNLRDLGHEVWFLGLGLKPCDGERLREAWGNNVHIIPHVRARASRPRSYGIRRVIQDRLIVRGISSPGVDYWYWPHWDEQIKEFAAQHSFDVVIAEYVFFSRALLNFDNSVFKIIDTHDVFTDRAEKLRARNIKSFYRYLTRDEEARGLSRADAVIAIQKHEAEHFRSLVSGGKSVITVGHTVTLKPLPLPETSDILFIGSDNHLNIDGITHFLSHCFPQIRSAIPNARLLVAGSICRQLTALPDGVEMLGEVDDLETAYAGARVVINPMIVGTGLKTKSVEALGFGRPLVTTPCGAEGLEEGCGSIFLLGETPEAFAAAVVRVLKDEGCAAELAANAVRFVRDWNRAQLASLSQIISTAKTSAPAKTEPGMRILASPAYKNREANPYNAALYSALEAGGVAVREFTKKRVLLDRWDIVHIHWPDTPLHCRNAASAALLAAYHILRLLHAKVRGAKIVWTVHNLHSHNTAHPCVERWLWRAFLPLVDATIHLSRSGLDLALRKFPRLASLPRFVIPHGHYRGCYPNDHDRPAARSRLGLEPDGHVIAFTGQIKPYKNVPALADAFLNAAIPRTTLLIAGKPCDAAIERGLAAYAEKSPRVVCHPNLIPENEMQNYLNACDLAVFPYLDILNSGSAILALSFDRPVLVPARGAMAELQEQVGADWVMTYEGDLTGEMLRRALIWACETSRPARCDLSALDWEFIACRTRDVYQTIMGGVPIPESSITEVLA